MNKTKQQNRLNCSKKKVLTIFNITFGKREKKNFYYVPSLFGCVVFVTLPCILFKHTSKLHKMKTDVLLWRFVSRGLIGKYNKIRKASPLLPDSSQFCFIIFCFFVGIAYRKLSEKLSSQIAKGKLNFLGDVANIFEV